MQAVAQDPQAGIVEQKSVRNVLHEIVTDRHEHNRDEGEFEAHTVWAGECQT